MIYDNDREKLDAGYCFNKQNNETEMFRCYCCGNDFTENEIKREKNKYKCKTCIVFDEIDIWYQKINLELQINPKLHKEFIEWKNNAINSVTLSDIKFFKTEINNLLTLFSI